MSAVLHISSIHTIDDISGRLCIFSFSIILNFQIFWGVGGDKQNMFAFNLYKIQTLNKYIFTLKFWIFLNSYISKSISRFSNFKYK